MHDHFIAKISYETVNQPPSYEINGPEQLLTPKISRFENERVFIFCMGLNLPDNFFEQLCVYYAKQALEQSRTINGVFSFILIDKCSYQCYVLTDYTCVFPLYYLLQEKTLILSNKQSALLPYLKQGPQCNLPVFFELLYNGFSMPGSTLIQNINTVSPHRLLHFNGKINDKEITPVFDEVPFSEKKLMDLVITAFERLCGQDKEVHILSSGGLDSAFMVAVCAKILNKK